jgi:hypothetical protein
MNFVPAEYTARLLPPNHHPVLKRGSRHEASKRTNLPANVSRVSAFEATQDPLADFIAPLEMYFPW